MHQGEFIGSKAADQPKRILILGESHHWSSEDDSKTEEERRVKAEAYSTEDVVKTYLANYNSNIGKERDQCYRFFDNIVHAFGINPDTSRTDFWERVYFGNYIDELCGVRDKIAAKILNSQGNREKYNSQLFSFIQEHKIDIVFCFSRRVYNKLPPTECFDKEMSGDKTDTHRLDKCVYHPGPRKSISVSLVKPVTVYGLKHPSQGFSYRRYQDKLKELL